ncbi:hypothetical protein CY34DRAFT_134435 [Suillus luteus UH-Slu-Lm8-n1]|uniref:Uncharacterized protein n=1 Tax=Suillus luteus UH-Slu-Lm8-n1 TaxID=930992 RepID=A0A0D0BHI4_9AGAM|nr:hypothetical protein CY34DRAFT_134435 [Suillus luteus UH-Slu-Lm8-n1]
MEKTVDKNFSFKASWKLFSTLSRVVTCFYSGLCMQCPYNTAFKKISNTRCRYGRYTFVMCEQKKISMTDERGCRN